MTNGYASSTFSSWTIGLGLQTCSWKAMEQNEILELTISNSMNISSITLERCWSQIVPCLTRSNWICTNWWPNGTPKSWILPEYLLQQYSHFQVKAQEFLYRQNSVRFTCTCLERLIPITARFGPINSGQRVRVRITDPAVWIKLSPSPFSVLELYFRDVCAQPSSQLARRCILPAVFRRILCIHRTVGDVKLTETFT